MTVRRLAIVVALAGCVLIPWTWRRRRRSPRAPDAGSEGDVGHAAAGAATCRVGTVTARVIRGALTNPLPGQTVELTGARRGEDREDR